MRSTSPTVERKPTNGALEHHESISRVMRDLNAVIMLAIDRRIHMLTTAGTPRYETESCPTCDGTGYILNDRHPFDEDDGVSRPPSPDCSLDVTPEMALLLGLRTRATPPPSPDVPVDASSASGSGTSSLPLATISTPSSVPGPSSTLHGQGPPANTAAPAPVIAPTPVVPSVPAVAPLPVFAHAPPSTVPVASTPIPGLYYLGPDYPAPMPDDAVFAGPGQDRYYTITRGIRVGVFSGWQNTSPYVTGVGSAIYSRHSSLEAAFLAYTEAYNRTAVKYV